MLNIKQSFGFFSLIQLFVTPQKTIERNKKVRSYPFSDRSCKKTMLSLNFIDGGKQ